MLQGHRMSFGWIAAPDDLRLRIADIVEAVGHRAVAPGIGYPGDRRRMANPRLVIGVVGPPEGAELAEKIGALVGEFRRAEPVDRVGARLLADRHQLVADLVDGLVPIDPGPLAVDQLQRIFETPLPGDQLAHRGTLGAMRPAVDRAVPARLLTDPHTIGHLGRHGAADRAVSADAFADRHLRTGRRRWSGLGPAHAGERQGAQRPETTGNKARTAQERAAVEAAIRSAGKSGEIPEPGPTLRSLDQ